MNTDIDSLKSFLDKIKSLNFIQRIFFWKSIRNQLIDAVGALSRLLSEHQNLQDAKANLNSELLNTGKDLQIANDKSIRFEIQEKSLTELIADKERHINELRNQLAISNTTCGNLKDQLQKIQNELTGVKEGLRHAQQNFNAEREECIKLKKEEDARKTEHSTALTTFQSWKEQIQKDRNAELEEKKQQELNRLLLMKQTWVEHEQNVKNRIKAICQKHTIEYADSVPFKGTPDNTIRLSNEYIIFDAKSPGSDDVNNFAGYIKEQAERAKKYAKQDSVKKDIFFVIPSNTLHVLKQTVFPHGDYDVFLVSVDVLEPILLCLQKIETYEFAEQLTPEERENICRIIGRFTHLTKRRIQIDSFFAKQFMEMVLKCDSDLPDEIKKEVFAFEKIEKLNPPSDRRTKALDNKQLQTEVNQLELEIGGKGVVIEDLSQHLNNVKLYKD
jgi:hypothetical protein